MSEAEITYRNVLREEKGIEDFKKWLEYYWPVQKSWGASDYELWEEGRNVVCCRYTVENIDIWNRRSVGPDAETLVSTLNAIVNLDRVSLKITFPKDLPA